MARASTRPLCSCSTWKIRRILELLILCRGGICFACLLAPTIVFSNIRTRWRAKRIQVGTLGPVGASSSAPHPSALQDTGTAPSGRSRVAAWQVHGMCGAEPGSYCCCDRYRLTSIDTLSWDAWRGARFILLGWLSPCSPVACLLPLPPAPAPWWRVSSACSVVTTRCQGGAVWHFACVLSSAV